MDDNALIREVRAAIIAGEASAGIPGLPIKQAFQPTQQGPNTAPTCYLHKVDNDRVGSPHAGYEWNELQQKMVYTFTQQLATTLQFSALSTQDPANLNQKTASDILNLIAFILQNQTTIELLQEKGIGIQRIMKVRNPPFTDDRARYEYGPNLDSIFTHKQVIITETPIITTTEFQVFSV